MDNFEESYQSGLRLALLPLCLLCAAGGGAAGCGEVDDVAPMERPEGRFTLIDQTEWQFTESDEDPFTDRPIAVRCPTNSWGTEELDGNLAVAVTTGFCEYFAVHQETVETVYAGDVLNYRVFHFGLEADFPTRAHVALRLGERVLLDEQIEIPSDSALLAGQVEVDETVPAGTRAYFHVHNHGTNEYSLIELSAEAP